MKRAITYGTFDMFHIGHLKLLERIKQDCDHLTVAVSTDEFNAVKGKKTVIPYEDRAAIVASLKLVDRVIPENDWEQKTPDIINGICQLVCHNDCDVCFGTKVNECLTCKNGKFLFGTTCTIED